MASQCPSQNLSPREQALEFVKRLKEAVEAAGAQMPPWGVGCAFAEVEFSDGPAAGDLDGLVLSPKELEWCGKALPALLVCQLGVATRRSDGETV